MTVAEQLNQGGKPGFDPARQFDGGTRLRACYYLPDRTTSQHPYGLLCGIPDVLATATSLLTLAQFPFPGSPLTLPWTFNILT